MRLKGRRTKQMPPVIRRTQKSFARERLERGVEHVKPQLA